MAAKKKSSAKKGGAKFGAKAAFVRSLNPEVPAKEVVARGKLKGLKLSEGYVYTIRSGSGLTKKRANASPSKARSGASRGRAGASGRRGRAAAASGMTPAEAQLRDAIADLGLVRASEILESVKASIKGR